MKLTAQEIAALRWMKKLNAAKQGFLWESVRKHGALPELDRLVVEGLCQYVRYQRGPRSGRNSTRCGYYITDAGRTALSEAEGGK